MSRWIQGFLIAACALTSSVLTAKQSTADEEEEESSDMIGVYFGGFGGWIFPYSVSVTQRGTAFYKDSAGGPLDVEAHGSAQGKTKGIGGAHLGYEWMCPISPGFRLAPALEVEGSYFANTNKKAKLSNDTARLPEHNFIDNFPSQIGTLLANGILEFNNDYVSPYFGVGVGVGFVSIHDAKSAQIAPPEAGVNHFNSGPSDYHSLFATQAKAGLRYRFLKHYRLSAEYRYIYITSSDFFFGAARYATHVPTSPWTVKFGRLAYNTVTLGLDFMF